METMPLTDTIGNQIKSSVLSMDHHFSMYSHRASPKTLQAIAIALPPELDGKTQLLKITHT